MRNKAIISILIALLLLAALGVVVKGGLESGKESRQKSPPSEPIKNPVLDRLKAQRSLFEPLKADGVPRINMYIGAAPAGAINTKPADPLQKIQAKGASSPAKAMDSFSATKLLQGNQHKQKATQFTKISFDGQVLPNSALRWSCARDTQTGLLWETKLFDAGVSDVEHRYSWYQPMRAASGFKDRGSCYGIPCDTHSYTMEMNRLGLCGSRHWRLPTFSELETLLDRDYFNPVINQEIFFNAHGASYWTQSQLENNPQMVMQIDFFNGTSSPAPIHFKLAVRLVSE